MTKHIFLGVLLSLMLCGPAWGAGKTIDGDLTVTGDFTSGSVVSGGPISVDDTTDSTSTTTGSIHTDGGLGVAKKSFFGDDMDLGGNDIVNSNIQPLVNTKMPSQAVELTAAASGSTGITVADNANIDFGTGNFTLVWRGSLPDWTPGTVKYLFHKLGVAAQGYALQINASGTFGLYVDSGADAVEYDSTKIPTFIDGTVHDIVAVMDKGSAAIYYVDGILFESIAASDGYDLSNTSDLYVAGSSVTRAASRTEAAYTFTRALTAAEVADLYDNGVAFEDKWGSQTELVTNGDMEAALVTLNGVAVTSTSGSTIAQSADQAHAGSNSMKVTATAASVMAAIIPNDTDLNGKRVNTSGWVYIPSTNTTLSSIGVYYKHDGTITSLGTISTLDAWTYYSYSYVHGTEPSTDRDIYFYNPTGMTVGDVFYVDDVSFTMAGATLALVPENIQTDKWYNASSNTGLDASYPAAGASLVRPADDVFPSNVTIAGNVGIGTAAPEAELHITSAGSYQPSLRFENTNADAFGPGMVFKKTSASQADGDSLGNLYFQGKDSGGTNTNFVLISAVSDTVADGTEAGSVHIKTYVAGVNTEVMTIKSGNVGIRTTAPDMATEINHTTGQNLRLTYNDANGSAANKVDFTVSSSGDLTIAPSGGDVAITGSISATVACCADYVFDSTYKLPTIEDMESHVKEAGHLPGMTQGVGRDDKPKPMDLTKAIGELIVKIEEQSLYIIHLNKRIRELEGLK